MTNQKILLGYRRKSVVRDATDLVSTEQQTNACEQWLTIKFPDYTIEWYEDIDRSGRDERGRPGWQKLMRQIERPEVVGVISYSFDRMYRNVHQFLNFLNRLEALNKRLITVKEGLDTSTAMGRAVVTILMVIAQLESDQTSERMKTAVKYRREVQGRHWGPTPFGCERDDKGQLIPSTRGYWYNPHTGEAKNSDDRPGEQWEVRQYYDALRLIYKLYAGGEHSYDTLTSNLNEIGWRFIDRHGQPRLFDRDDVRRSLAYWQLFRGELPTGKIQRKQGPILTGGHAPVLPVELCNQVGYILSQRKNKFTRKTTPHRRVYLLSNILFCGVCQHRMTGAIDHGWEIYRHQGRKGDCPEHWVSADILEAEILAYLAQLGDEQLLKEIRIEAERLAREVFATDDKNKGALIELDRQRERLSILEDLYLDKGIVRERYEIKKAEINETIARLEKELYTVGYLTNFDEVLARMTASLSQIVDAPAETKKALIYSIFERVEIAEGKIVKTIPRPWARGFF